MDYLKQTPKIICLILLISFLSACDTEVSPEPLRITGTPPTLMYYGSPFEYTFGATGGDGVYRYRYIQNPDIDDDEELFENPVEMSIEVLDSAKPQFKLRAVPKLPSNANFSEINNRRHRYQIELTDGVNTVVQSYEFTLNKNTLKVSKTSSAKEGTVTNTVASNLANQLNSDNKSRICNEISKKKYEKYSTEYGFAYPFVFQVIADSEVSERTEIFYRFKTNYQDSDPERSPRNVDYARKNVDFIDEVKSIVLEPGQIVCVAHIDILDDLTVEGDEEVFIEFFDSIGGQLDYGEAQFSLVIKDNEELPKYKSNQITRNSGDKVIVPININRPVDYPITMNVRLDTVNSTIGQEGFSMEPASGVVTIPPGQIQAAFNINLPNLQNNDISNNKDERITLITDLDDILDQSPYTIDINKWFKESSIEFEAIGNSKQNGQKVVDFIAEESGAITTLSEYTNGSHKYAKLELFSPTPNAADFKTQKSFVFSLSDQDLVPVAIDKDTKSDSTNFAVILKVNKLFANVYRGKTDFVVALLNRTSSNDFELISVRQYGTEGDDLVTGTKIDNGTLYVYGQTDGENFEGAPSNQTNFGNKDGFVYSISLSSNQHQWSRFLGTSEEDNVTSLDVSNREITAAVSIKNSDEDILIKKLSIVDGTALENIEDLKIASSRNDVAVDLKYDFSASKVLLLAHSDADLISDDTLTSSLSSDVQLLAVNSDNAFNRVENFATDQDDEARALEVSPNKLKVLVGGNTLGEFKDNTRRGQDGNDIFISILDSESNNLQTASTLQFGSPANDELISIKPVSNTKFFALWREEYTEPNHSVYRISAFSTDGKKLSRDPE